MEGEQATQEPGEKRKEAPEEGVAGPGAPATKKAKEEQPEEVGVFVVEGVTIRLQMEHKRQKSMSIKQQKQQAYRQRLVQCIRANDMVTAFRVYEQMKELSLSFDSKVFNMMLALCGGAMGERPKKQQQQSQHAGDEGVDGHYGPSRGGNGGDGGWRGGGGRGRGNRGGRGGRNNTGGRGGRNRNGDHVVYAEADGKGPGAGKPGREEDGGGDAEEGASEAVHPGSADANPSFAVECAFKIFADMEAALLKGQAMVEACFTALIRACCRDGQVERALGVLADMETRGIAPRLRSFSPLLAACASRGALQTCLECRDKAVASKVELGDKEHADMVRACTMAGDAASFQAVVADYMEDVLQPQSKESWEALSGFFRSPAAAALGAGGGASSSDGASGSGSSGGGGGDSSDAATGLQAEDASAASAPPADSAAPAPAAAVETAVGLPAEAVEAAPLAAVAATAAEAAVVVEGGSGGSSSWKIGEGTISDLGECSCCGETLRSIELSDKDTERLLLQVETLACGSDIQKEQWVSFKAWLEAKGRGAYDYVLDGANVGYYKMKNQDAHQTTADLQQIDRVMAQLRLRGKKALVVLHARHLNDRKLAPASLQVLQRWRQADCVYSCEPRNNDDWYWLYAAAWMGGRTLVLTNDEMRDHHFNMLSHRSFNRWKERHQVRFWFSEEASGPLRQSGPRTLVTAEPTLYSKRMQCSDSGACWHFPLEGSDAWLCISRQKNSGGNRSSSGDGSSNSNGMAAMDIEPAAVAAAAPAAAGAALAAGNA